MLQYSTTIAGIGGGAYRPGKDDKGKLHSKEDAMHFEVSREMLLEWAQLGYLGSDAQKFATKKETLKLQGAVIPAKSKEDLTSRVIAGQAIKPVTNPLAPKPLPSNDFFKRPLPRGIDEPWPGWFGRTAKSRAKSWFR